jgi:hypothetical protein
VDLFLFGLEKMSSSLSGFERYLDPKKDIGIQKNKKTPFGQEVSVI